MRPRTATLITITVTTAGLHKFPKFPKHYGKIPGPRWSNFVQQHLDNEYIAYVPLIVAFSLIAAFVVAGRPFLTRPYAATTKVGAAESC